MNKNNNKAHEFAFGKENYIIMIIGIIVLALGYILMTGGGSSDPNVFSAEEIFSVRRLTIAPLVLIAGFVIIVVSIMKKPKE